MTEIQQVNYCVILNFSFLIFIKFMLNETLGTFTLEVLSDIESCLYISKLPLYFPKLMVNSFGIICFLTFIKFIDS